MALFMLMMTFSMAIDGFVDETDDVFNGVNEWK